MKNNKSIWYVGDIHGNFNYLLYKIKELGLKDVDIVQVGDFGVGFGHREKIEPLKDTSITLLNRQLKQYNIILYVCRGNHDNPLYFDKLYDFGNIKLVPDYEVINIKGKNILFVGGAISIDRTGRNKNIDHWDNDNFIYDVDKINAINNVDIVVTHTAPNIARPFGVNALVNMWAQNDPNLLNELMCEREYMNSMLENLKERNPIKMLVYGHFHSSYKEVIEGINFVLLDTNEFYEYVI